jgi:hypothetical protein
MTYLFIKNIMSNSGDGTEAIFYLKNLLVSAGWEVKSSGDGLTNYNATGDVFTNEGPGPLGLGNINAWFRIQMPLLHSVRREYLFQRLSGSNWKIGYSYNAKFIDSVPTASVAPTASDAYVFEDVKLFSGNQRCFVLAQDGYYSNFALCGMDQTTNSPRTLLAGDTLQPNSYSSYEYDPYVIWLNTQPDSKKPNIENLSSNTESVLMNHCWFGKNQLSPPELFVKCSILLYKSNSGYLHTNNNFGYGTNFTGKVDMLPIFLGRFPNLANPRGCKGISSLFYFHSISALNGDTFSVLSQRDRIVLGDINVPWDGSIPSLAVEDVEQIPDPGDPIDPDNPGGSDPPPDP